MWGALRMWLRAGEMAVEDLPGIGEGENGVLDPTKKVDEEDGADKLSLRCWYGVKQVRVFLCLLIFTHKYY